MSQETKDEYYTSQETKDWLLTPPPLAAKHKNSKYRYIRNKIRTFADTSSAIFTDDMTDEEIKEECLRRSGWY